MILDIAYTQHQGTDWRYPVQQDALWNSLEVIQSRNLHPACLQTQADVVSLAVADVILPPYSRTRPIRNVTPRP